MPLVHNSICNVTHLQLDSAPNIQLSCSLPSLFWWNLEFENSCRYCIISQSSETIVVRLQLFALGMTTSQAILGSSAICDLRGRSQSISHSFKNSIKQVSQAAPGSRALKAHSPAVLRLHTNLRVSHHLHPKRLISSLEDSCL